MFYVEQLEGCCTIDVLYGFPYNRVRYTVLDELDLVKSYHFDYRRNKYRSLKGSLWWKDDSTIQYIKKTMEYKINESKQRCGFMIASTIPAQSKFELILEHFGFYRVGTTTKRGHRSHPVTLWNKCLKGIDYRTLNNLVNKPVNGIQSAV